MKGGICTRELAAERQKWFCASKREMEEDG